MSSHTHVLYHKSCADGFGAAWAAWKALGWQAKYTPVQYGEPLPEIADGSRVYIVDFSYPRETLVELNERTNQLVVLDHHKTAEQELADLPFATFDMEKSGAILAWEFFHGDRPVPSLLRYVEDRDLWRWKLENSRAVSAALRLHAFDFEEWDRLSLDELTRDGSVCERLVKMLTESIANKARLTKIAGYMVPVVATPVYQSEVCAELLALHPEAKFAAAYFEHDQTESRIWSLRSRSDFDVSAIAKQFGGGGHRQAAGFKQTMVPWIGPDESYALARSGNDATVVTWEAV